MPVQYLQQRPGIGRGRNRRQGRRRRHGPTDLPSAGFRPLQGPEEVVDSFGFVEGRDGQTDPECALDAQRQFRPAEAVNAEIALEAALRRQRYGTDTLGLEVTQERADQLCEFVQLGYRFVQRPSAASRCRRIIGRSAVHHGKPTVSGSKRITGRSMKVMAHSLPAVAGFMEDCAYHFDPSGPAALGAHVLEI